MCGFFGSDEKFLQRISKCRASVVEGRGKIAKFEEALAVRKKKKSSVSDRVKLSACVTV